jgi:hypothetical protein
MPPGHALHQQQTRSVSGSAANRYVRAAQAAMFLACLLVTTGKDASACRLALLLLLPLLH